MRQTAFRVKFDFSPTLANEHVLVRPRAASEFDQLYDVAKDPLIWVQHPESKRYKQDLFAKRFFPRSQKKDVVLVIVDRATSQMIGSSRFYDFSAEHRHVKIGYTFLARSHWGGVFNRHVKSLMLDHAFKQVDRVYFEVSRNNLRSCRALENLGARLCDDKNVLSELDLGCHTLYALHKNEWHSAAP